MKRNMKKTYKTPAMKVRAIQCSQMVCESVLGINYNQSAYDGQSAWSKEENDLAEEDFSDFSLEWE